MSIRYQDEYEDLIAYIEGSLDDVGAARLEKRLAASEELRAEYAWVKSVMSDLDRVRETPGEIDILDSVLRRIPWSAGGPEMDFSVLADYIDDALDPEEAQEIRRRLETMEEAQADCEWAKVFMADCRDLQVEHAARAAGFDCVEQVLGVIEGSSNGTTQEGFSWRRAVERGRRVAWVILAAAAAVVLSFGAVRYFMRAPDPDAAIPVARDERPSSMTVAQETEVKRSDTRYEVLRRRSPAPWRVSSVESPVFEAVAPSDSEALTPESIVDTWRSAGTDASAWTKIRQWATITAEQARAIIVSKQQMPEAVVGASAALAPAESEAALLTAVGHMPADPAVRFALAKAYYAQPSAGGAAQATLGDLQSLDAGNALPYYLEAKLLLDSGDVEGALNLLAQARNLHRASAYALRSAQFQEQALRATGMAADSARLLTAMTAGVDQYDFLCQLGEDLLQYGNYFEESGETQVAEELYQSVQRLGQQLNSGAEFLPEQIAGLDVERQAVTSLENLYTALGATEGIEALTTQALDLIGRIENIEEFARVLEGFFSVTTDPATWVGWAGALLEAGTAPLFNLFRVGRLDITEFIRNVTGR